MHDQELSKISRNWVAGCLGAAGLILIGYAGFSEAPLPEEELPRLLARGEQFPMEEEGEVPLFEPPGLAPVPSGELQLSSEASHSFDKVDPGHWIVAALQEAFPDVDAATLEGRSGEVTRYELAVAMQRAFELYEKQAPQTSLDQGRLALIEKLSHELREELALLGIGKDKVESQLEGISQRVTRNEARLDEQGQALVRLEGKVADLLSRLQVQEDQGAKRGQLLASLQTRQAKSEKKSKGLSEILSRMAVKTSIAEARSKSMQKKLDQVQGRNLLPSPTAQRQVVELESRVRALESRPAPSTKGDPSVRVFAQRLERLEKRNVLAQATQSPDTPQVFQDRLKRLERLVLKVYEKEKAKGTPDSQKELAAMRQGIGLLAQRLEKVEGGSAPEGQLDEVKGMLKGFLRDFSKRLNRVEKQVF